MKDKRSRGFIAWITNLIPRPQTPPYAVIEIEKPISVLEKGDAAAIASLKNHPGMTALLNRLKLQQAALIHKLCTTRFKTLDDATFIQSSLFGVRMVELEIRNATQNLETRKERIATVDETVEFEKALSAIESVGATSIERN